MAGIRSVTSMSALMAALGMVALTGAAIAQEGKDKMRLSEAQCESALEQGHPDNKAKITESEARAYITDMKAVNKDKDGTIERAEFMRACDMGLVKSSASAGEGSGTSGSERYDKRGDDNRDHDDRTRVKLGYARQVFWPVDDIRGLHRLILRVTRGER